MRRLFASSPTPLRNGKQFAVRRVLAFGKHEHAVALINGFSRVGKALAETGLPRQRK